MEHHDELMDSSCPACDYLSAPMLAIVSFPTLEEAEQNLAKTTDEEKQPVPDRSNKPRDRRPISGKLLGALISPTGQPLTGTASEGDWRTRHGRPGATGRDATFARRFGFYDGWHSATLRCPSCDWSGVFQEGMLEYHDESMESSCPACDALLCIVSMPTIEEMEQYRETQERRARDEERQLIRARRRWLEAFDATSLQSPSQLPEWVGPAGVLNWDCTLDDAEDASRPHHTVIRHGDREIWREPECWEGYERFGEVAQILKQKYGKQLVDLVPTAATELYLFGDRITAPDHVDRVRASLTEGDATQRSGRPTGTPAVRGIGRGFEYAFAGCSLWTALGSSTSSMHGCYGRHTEFGTFLNAPEFEQHARPYLPGTVVELRRLWRGAQRCGYWRGQRFVVGPYCQLCGVNPVWLFRPDGTLDRAADRSWVRRHCAIVVEGQGQPLFVFPRPWPPVHLGRPKPPA